MQWNRFETKPNRMKWDRTQSVCNNSNNYNTATAKIIMTMIMNSNGMSSSRTSVLVRTAAVLCCVPVVLLLLNSFQPVQSGSSSCRRKLRSCCLAIIDFVLCDHFPSLRCAAMKLRLQTQQQLLVWLLERTPAGMQLGDDVEEIFGISRAWVPHASQCHNHSLAGPRRRKYAAQASFSPLCSFQHYL